VGRRLTRRARHLQVRLSHTLSQTQVPGLCARDLQVELLRPPQTSRQMSYATYRLHHHRQGTYFISIVCVSTNGRSEELHAGLVQVPIRRLLLIAHKVCHTLTLYYLSFSLSLFLSLSLSLSLSHTHTHTQSPCSSAKQRSGSCPLSLPPGLVLTFLALLVQNTNIDARGAACHEVVLSLLALLVQTYKC
jgi:hypothetical protein